MTGAKRYRALSGTSYPGSEAAIKRIRAGERVPMDERGLVRVEAGELVPARAPRAAVDSMLAQGFAAEDGEPYAAALAARELRAQLGLPPDASDEETEAAAAARGEG